MRKQTRREAAAKRGQARREAAEARKKARKEASKGRKWLRRLRNLLLLGVLFCLIAHTAVVIRGNSRILDLGLSDGEISPDRFYVRYAISFFCKKISGNRSHFGSRYK